MIYHLRDGNTDKSLCSWPNILATWSEIFCFPFVGADTCQHILRATKMVQPLLSFLRWYSQSSSPTLSPLSLFHAQRESTAEAVSGKWLPKEAAHGGSDVSSSAWQFNLLWRRPPSTSSHSTSATTTELWSSTASAACSSPPESTTPAPLLRYYALSIPP